MSAERAFRGAALAWAALAFALLAAVPDTPIEGFGNHRLPALVHAFTMGVLVNGVYALQWSAWRRVFGRVPPWPWLGLFVWGLHQAGAALAVAGFLLLGLRAANVGAHYLIPGGIALHIALALAVAWRRAPGTPRHLAVHVPWLGLVVTMALGALVLLDELTGRYGLFTPPTLLLHGLSGAFLFLLPALWLADLLPGGAAPLERTATAPLLLGTVPLALGVLLVALGNAPGGAGYLVPAGLALLGATLLWGAWPSGRRPARGDPADWMRTVWGLPGLLLLFAAIRALRGVGLPEDFLLAKLGVVAVLLVAGVPELLLRVTAPRGAFPTRRRAGGTLALVGAGLLVLAGQLAAAEWLVRAGALAGIAGVALLALTRKAGPSSTP